MYNMEIYCTSGTNVFTQKPHVYRQTTMTDPKHNMTVKLLRSYKNVHRFEGTNFETPSL